jgi:soluble lytic murein transglycosylase
MWFEICGLHPTSRRRVLSLKTMLQMHTRQSFFVTRTARARATVASLLTLVVLFAMAAAPTFASASQPAKKKKPAPARTTSTTARRPGSLHGGSLHGSSPHGHAKTSSHSSRKTHVRVREVSVAPTAESRRLSSAFTASAQLRPMAQQLASTRSPASFNGVLSYAASHPGEGAAAADLALGHAHFADGQYPQAEAAYRQATQSGAALADYADYLGAQAAVAAKDYGTAGALLDHFAVRHPASIFVNAAPILLANAYLLAGNPGGAVSVLVPLNGTQAANRTDFRLALGKAYAATGNTAQAATLFRGIYLHDPLSAEAAAAKTQLQALNVPLTAPERKTHADAMFNAKHYEVAAVEYRSIKHDEAGLSQADQDALEIYAAVCDLRLKRLSKSDVSKLPITNDDSAALKLYMESELARNENDFSRHDELVTQLTGTYPHSRWLEEALYSGGNMYLLRHDYTNAIAQYTSLVEHFPKSLYAPTAEWRAAWLNYRMRRYTDAAKLMDQHIVDYPGSDEVPGALYWRGRIYEEAESNPGQALNFYTALDERYPNSYYALLARQKLAQFANVTRPAEASALAQLAPLPPPVLIAVLPENDPHLIKARLLANAALNEYIQPEIDQSATSPQWGALAIAEIYSSFGETTRSLQSMKHSGLPFFSTPVPEVPHIYWTLLFPRPYWDAIVANAQTDGLDPYLVASLIRQESEFNAGAVSRANAVGLMQVEPSTGKSEARKMGIKHFNANELLDPRTNLQIGEVDLKRAIDRYNGQLEYALAAYNAGDVPVRNWIAYGDYKDMPEWVESIPYTETREYVQAILRNREIYREVYAHEAEAHEANAHEVSAAPQ